MRCRIVFFCLIVLLCSSFAMYAIPNDATKNCASVKACAAGPSSAIAWADSKATQHKNETHPLSAAQREYENLLTELASSSNAVRRERGQRLLETYARLVNSSLTIEVLHEYPDMDESSGDLKYDGHTLRITLYGGRNALGHLSTVQELAHEFEHCRQVLDGEFSFRRVRTDLWVTDSVDRTDEAKAFAASFDADPVILFHDPFLTSLQRYLTFGGVAGAAEYLGKANTKYRWLPLGPVQVDTRDEAVFVPSRAYDAAGSDVVAGRWLH